MITIEKNVQIPPKRFRGPTAATAALRTAICNLALNDSFVLPVELEKKGSEIYALAKQYNIVLTARKVGDKTRVWRIA